MQQFQGNSISNEKDAVILDTHFANISGGAGLPVKHRKGVLNIEVKSTTCEVIIL